MLALHSQTKGEIPVDRPVVLWLIEHAGELLTKHQVGHDGRALCEQLFGMPCRGESFEFGEPVRYLARPGDRGRSSSARWGQGIWLGRRRGAAAR
eukprot:8920988-Alexandrium_andersonii.AAC.1